MRTAQASKFEKHYSISTAVGKEKSNPNRPLHFKGYHFKGACKCLVCDKLLASLTEAHAIGCGYPNKQALIDDGKVEYLGKS